MQNPRSRCYDESQPHEHSIIIATDGACKSNGRSDSAVGCGVFFGTNSVHNMSFCFPENGITKRRAELHACVYALQKVRDMIANGESNNGEYISQVIIKTDSAYVVNSMTDWVAQWRNNGYANGRGGSLDNQGLMRALDDACNDLGRLGIQVRFWQVTRAKNRQANRLANDALL